MLVPMLFMCMWGQKGEPGTQRQNSKSLGGGGGKWFLYTPSCTTEFASIYEMYEMAELVLCTL